MKGCRYTARILISVLLAALLSAAVPAAVAAEVLGQNETLLTATNEPGTRGQEMPLGNVTADAVRSSAGTDIAVVHGGCFQFNLLPGEITREDIDLVFPEEYPLVTAMITPKELWALLEHSVSTFVLGADERIDWQSSVWDGFLQVSGISFCFDVSNEAGTRVTAVSLSDGRELSRSDTDTLLSISATAQVFSGELGYCVIDSSSLDMSLTDAFIQYIYDRDGVLSAPDGAARIECIGAADDALFGETRFSAVLFLACAGGIALVGALTFGRSIAWKAMKDRAMPETEEEKNSALNRFMK